MPRVVNPDTIGTGPGKTVPGQDGTYTLIGPGMVGAGPNIGQPEYDGPQPPSEGGGASGAALDAHIHSLHAHPAAAITMDAHPDLIRSSNSQSAFDELMGAIPPEPPKLGQWFDHMTFSGIPDWGALKVLDADAKSRYLMWPTAGAWVISQNDPDEVYPYYLNPPSPTLDDEFTYQGGDPATDIPWNSGVQTVVGGGPGKVFAGGFTRLEGTDYNVKRTLRILEAEFVGIAQRHTLVCISGTIYPADRGVLALLHFPPEGDMSDFIAQDLLDRCVAAVLLGQGILGDACFEVGSVGSVGFCDGGPGGIFALGTDEDGYYDPFAYPGRASGQYDLDELHTGVSGIDGSALRSPWDDLNDDGVAGAQHVINVNIPAPGQVRLGTDPDANNAAGDAPVQPYGIPILGATSNAYNPAPAAGPAAIYNHPYIGSSLILDSNFLRYRLPYLDDYTADTGLKYTPSGVAPKTTKETARYFTPAEPYTRPTTTNPYVAYLFAPITPWDMTQAGNYDDFDQDYWTWQLARFRHSFITKNGPIGALNQKMDIGSYWLIHFKTEKSFEAFVRDGDITALEDIWGASPASADPEEYANLVNEVTGTAFSPDGPAPDYGYGGLAYHLLRSMVATSYDQEIESADFNTKTFQWTYAGGNPDVMWCSGVAYMTPRRIDGTQGFQITDLDIEVDDAWKHSYRTDDLELTNAAAPTAPAQISSPNPAFLGMAPFSYDVDGTGDPTMDVPVGVPPAGITDARGARQRRIEFPYTHLGDDGLNPYDETHGPQDTDVLEIDMNAPLTIDPLGDEDYPAFSIDAAIRAFLRRPLGHLTWEATAMPSYVAPVGHGERLTASPAATLLFHSTAFEPVNRDGKFGNYVDGASVPANEAYTELFDWEKDTHERFLDEVYRYRVIWDVAIGVPEKDHLTGPGMNGWALGPIAVPVRAGQTTTVGYVDASWTRNLDHTRDLATNPNLTGELQVAGLTDRNPPLFDWANAPFPSAGMLRYPNIDFSVGYRPDFANEAVNQPDYSGATGTREYVRCFDAAFSWLPSGSTKDLVQAAGQPFITLRIDGLDLEDFEYVAPGPGGHNPGGSGIAVMVKVPGLTTWMDAGRPDGAGPSKQDPALDGAGCQVQGPYTFSYTDDENSLGFSQVKINVGPFANLANGESHLRPGTADTVYEVPVLVKVIYKEMSVGEYDFTKENTGPGTFVGVAGAGHPSADIRALVGVRVVHPDDVMEWPGTITISI